MNQNAKPPVSDSTHARTELKITQKAMADANPILLSCYQRRDDEWCEIKLDERQDVLQVGHEAELCDLVVDDMELEPVQVRLFRFRDCWFFIETGSASLTVVNGIPKRQDFLYPGWGHFFRVGDGEIIIKTDYRYAVEANDEEPAAFSVEVGGQGLSFSAKESCLIGSHEACDIQVMGEPFQAIVSCFRGKVHVNAICADVYRANIKVDGQYATQMRFLKNGSKIMVGGYEITVGVPKSDKGKALSIQAANVNNNLALLELGADMVPGQKLIMPPAGQSVFLGRGSENYFQLNGSGISKRHSQLIIYRSYVTLVDCRSTNGTFVNKKRINSAKVKAGDIISLGDMNFLLCYST